MNRVLRLFASWLIIISLCALVIAPLSAQAVTPEPTPVEVVDPPVVVTPSGVSETLFLVVVVALALIFAVDKYLAVGAGKEAVAQLGASAPQWVTDALFNLAQDRIKAGKERAALTPDTLDDVSVTELEQRVIELQQLIDQKRAGGTPTPPQRE